MPVALVPRIGVLVRQRHVAHTGYLESLGEGGGEEKRSKPASTLLHFMQVAVDYGPTSRN